MKEKLLEIIVQEMKQGVVIIDDRGTILYANPFFQKTFAIEHSIEGTMLSDAVSNPLLLDAIGSVLSEKEGKSKEITLKGRVNQILELRIVPFSQDELKGTIVFLQDVTEEKRVEAIKRDFVANVSHELRTPLASIKGYAETLLDGGMEDRDVLKNFLTIIDRHANRMTALIDDLLTLSMLESHQIPMKFEPLDIRVIISNVIQGFEKQAKDKGIELIFERGVQSKEWGMTVSDSKNDHPQVMGDRVRLEQVIVNLVDNAIKYTNKGRVKISLRKVENFLQIDVSDTGIGIPEKDIPRIFERFYRVDKGRSRELGGTGLGLAIVKHIIQGHHGKILVNSEVGIGTTFSIQLPLNL